MKKETLTYTNEMMYQDKLWVTKEHDADVQGDLFAVIVNEAKEKGFTGIVDISVGNDQAKAAVFATEEDKQFIQETNESYLTYSLCAPLIATLEVLIQPPTPVIFDSSWNPKFLAEAKKFFDIEECGGFKVFTSYTKEDIRVGLYMKEGKNRSFFDKFKHIVEDFSIEEEVEACMEYPPYAEQFTEQEITNSLNEHNDWLRNVVEIIKGNMKKEMSVL